MGISKGNINVSLFITFLLCNLKDSCITQWLLKFDRFILYRDVICVTMAQRKRKGMEAYIGAIVYIVYYWN